MVSSAARQSLLLRTVALLAGVATLLVSVWQTWLLYTDAAPFHQPYLTATPTQNAAVTFRMTIALVGFPIAAAMLCVAATGLAVVRSWKACLRVVAGVGLLTTLHGWYIRFHLPYGFGSGYEHVSAAQQSHLTLANTGGVVGLVLAVALLSLSLLPSGRRLR